VLSVRAAYLAVVVAAGQHQEVAALAGFERREAREALVV
jgi:hypothetical protein